MWGDQGQLAYGGLLRDVCDGGQGSLHMAPEVSHSLICSFLHMVASESCQRGQAPCPRAFQTFARIMFADILLAQTSHLAELRVRVGGHLLDVRGIWCHFYSLSQLDSLHAKEGLSSPGWKLPEALV